MKNEYLHQLHPVRPRNSLFSEFHRNVLHPPSLSLFPDIFNSSWYPLFSFIFSNVTVSSCMLLTVPYRKRERAVSYQTSPIVPLTIYFSGETDSARQLVISYPSRREGWVQPITTVCCFLRKRGMKGGLLLASTLINRNALESLNSTVALYQAWTSCL